MDVNDCKAEIRRLQTENQNLRRRTHADLHAKQRRISQLEQQIQQTAWVYLPLYTMDTVHKTRETP